MKELNSFEREYFLQTRKEIDNEKHERDVILNIAVAILGGLAFAFLKDTNKDSKDQIQPIFGLLLTVSGLAIITSLLWLRKKKMQQIADRWHVIRNLVSKVREPGENGRFLEEIACDGLNKRSYTVKDTVLAIVLSTPFYSILLFQGLWGWICIGAHLVVCVRIFLPKVKDRTPLIPHAEASNARKLNE
jgi:uncharacterized membrane protein YraQ (UPF0718 family)